MYRIHWLTRVASYNSILLIIVLLIAYSSTSAQTPSNPNVGSSNVNISGVDISDALLTRRSANCADYVNTYTSRALEVATNTIWTGELSISLAEDSCTFLSNAVPNHNFNDGEHRFPNEFLAQNLSATITASPQFAAQPTALSLQYDNAILLNGVKVDLVAAGCFGVGNGRIGCNDMTTPWRYDPMSEFADFNVDSHNAHTQPTGEYHYHGNPKALFDDADPSSVSPVIGFAADGFPIFGSYFDDNGTIRKAASSYQLREGTRPTGEASPGGIYDGRFVDDYIYVAGSGDLDACNGMTVNGVYGYYVTESYPHILGCFSGTPHESFQKAARRRAPRQ